MNFDSLSLEIICPCNIAKNLSHFTNFPANIFLFGVRKNICTASFLDNKELLFESKCRYISAYLRKKIFVPEM